MAEMADVPFQCQGKRDKLLAMLYERIFQKFAEKNLRYAVIGGVAVNLHGYNRVTGDLDILIALDDRNIQLFTNVVTDLGLVPRLPVLLADFAVESKRKDWIENKEMKVFSVYNPKDPLEHIDVKIDRPENIDNYLAKADSLRAGDINIFVVDIDSLIELKKEAGRERDFIDIRALEEIKRLR